MKSIIKTVSQLLYSDWIRWWWIDITAYGDIERTLLCDLERTPDEGMQAAQDWETWHRGRISPYDNTLDTG